MSHAATDATDEDVPDPGIARAGAATAARRRELDISQRRLATDGIINAGALIAFEKGRSWPRDRTRARLEEALQWPPGAIADIRRGAAVPNRPAAAPEPASPPRVDSQEANVIAQVVTAAVDNCRAAAESLPAITAPGFTARLNGILAELRQLESVASRSMEVYGVTAALINALGTIRRHYNGLMLTGAAAPTATLGQRLYACRHRSNLSVSEAAQAANVAEEAVRQAEADEELTSDVSAALETLVRTINLA
ncbi:transcriptional regulator [Mycobacterium sp. M1]|uniref:Transcriptional regulator n=1 Tax=Mycolicibacter acidiphilus TaxID=2835306 RepID=A0ABS5RES8_9MYCO|nr:transcriptional regulator [Mycolicibacter acidiphilus]MBS9532773.1 transcriptional regulator [Mycolicibacter acidiphilus]